MINLDFDETVTPVSRPIYLDASALKRSYCETAFRFTLDGLRTRTVDPILTVGTAVHKFASERWISGDLPAMAAGAEIYKTADTDTAKFAAICSSFPRGLTPPPFSAVGYPRGVEFYFEAPWVKFQLADGTTHHIVVCGTIDLLTFHNGAVGIYDYKTTRKYKLEEAIAGYDKDMQFMFYRWAVWKFGHRFLPLELHNAARDGKLASHVVIVQLGTANKPTRWTVGPAERSSADDFVFFEDELKLRLAHLLSANPHTRAGWISNQCPRCPYKPICHALPGMEDAVRNMQFYTKEYKPQEHT